MAVKVKEIKDDAIINVKVNKAYYLMLKGALYFLFEQNNMSSEQREASLKNIMEKDYPSLNDFEKTFQTITRMLGEIEKEAAANDLFVEKEIAEPGDEGYVAPTPD
ncbi:MAG: hypothetical protein ACW98X_27275 [Promethearchaeota archaeon]|jgi:hypothetical protein